MDIIKKINKYKRSIFFFCFFFLFFFFSNVTAANLVSNGVENGTYNSMGSYLSLHNVEETCEEIYGFVPCSKSAAGNVFLILGYGYMMFIATTYLSNGSELLLEMMGKSFVSGCFLRLLGSLPDALLVLVSGLYGSTTTAEEKVSIGMGLMAGSTVMRLTLLWGSYVLVGKCDLNGSVTSDEKDTKGFTNLLDSGVSTDIWTKYGAWIMSISIVPLLVVQFPKVLAAASQRHLAVLIALIISALLLISYCLYEVFQPEMQERWIDYVMHKRIMTGFLKHMITKNPLGRLCNSDGSLNKAVITRLFEAIDTDGDKELSRRELKAFVIGIQFEGISLCEEDVADRIMKEFDIKRQDGAVDLEEFIEGITRLLSLISGEKVAREDTDIMQRHLDSVDEEAKTQHSLLGDTREKYREEIENARKVAIKAVMWVIIGIIIVGLFAEPLIEAFHHFSDATGIPMFFLSFVVLPLATNSGEAVSALTYISKKKRRSTSLTFSELYGVVTVNNLLCLIAFLAVVYVRSLSWEFSAEMLIIFLVFVIMGGFASFRTVFPLWTAYAAFLVYPLMLFIVYLLKYVFGWS